MSVVRASLAAALCGCGASSDVVHLPGGRGAPADAATPDGARHAWGQAPPPCYAPMGRVELADGRRCAGVLVGPARVLTTGSCLRDRSGANHLPARDLAFRLHGAPREVPALRVVHLDDPDDGRPGADLAVLTLTARVLVGDAPAPVAALRESPALPDAFTLASYTDAAATVLAVSAPCRVTRDDGDTLLHDCALDAAVAGGALIECAGGQATVYAIDPRAGGALAAARGLDGLPFHPRSVAATADAEGRPVVFAWDGDTARLHLRARAESGWGAWRVLPDPRAPDGATAGTLAAFGLPAGEVAVAFHERGAALQYRWALPGEPSLFSAWYPDDAAPSVRRFVSVAGGGGPRERPRVYALGDRGEVVTRAMASDAPGADWSPWCSLGAVAGATRVAAVHFTDVATGRAAQVFAATSSGVVTRWAALPVDGCDPWNSAGWVGLGTGSSLERVTAVSAGLLRDGRPFVVSALTGGAVRYTARLADGSAWERDVAFPAAGVVRELAAGRLADGRALVIAVSAEGAAPTTSAEEIFYAEESGAGGFAGARWRRFYR